MGISDSRAPRAYLGNMKHQNPTSISHSGNPEFDLQPRSSNSRNRIHTVQTIGTALQGIGFEEEFRTQDLLVTIQSKLRAPPDFLSQETSRHFPVLKKRVDLKIGEPRKQLFLCTSGKKCFKRLILHEEASTLNRKQFLVFTVSMFPSVGFRCFFESDFDVS